MTTNSIANIETTDDFLAVVTSIKDREGYVRPQAFAIGLAHIGRTGNVLAVRYPHVNYNENFGSAAIFHEVAELNDDGSVSENYLNDEKMDLLDHAFQPFLVDGKTHHNIEALKAVSMMWRTLKPFDGVVRPVVVFIRDLRDAPKSTADAYLRLHLLSCCKIKPDAAMFNGVFGQLTNCAWTREEGPVEAAHFQKLNMEYMMSRGRSLTVDSVDRFPRMTDFVVPPGIRIANADMVRLGAHLAPKTTVMHYGFVNANAGTLGESMVEGNIPMGVTVDEGTDVGAGAGFLGTLSGGNKIKTGAGKNCLIGTRSECGIMLGDNVCVSLGVCFTGNTKVKVITYMTTEDGTKFLTDKNGSPIIRTFKIVKAKELTGISNVTIRRNSLDGCIEVIPVPNGVQLNDMLHRNDWSQNVSQRPGEIPASFFCSPILDRTIFFPIFSLANYTREEIMAIAPAIIGIAALLDAVKQKAKESVMVYALTLLLVSLSTGMLSMDIVYLIGVSPAHPIIFMWAMIAGTWIGCYSLDSWLGTRKKKWKL